ncbi:MAG: hypothetical protein JXQ72_11735 [Anaerolineae bacterium]|nr:hypothetical protein [Anaerolineae bacterium]
MKTISTWWGKNRVKPVFPQKCLVCKRTDGVKSLNVNLAGLGQSVSVYYCAEHYADAERFVILMERKVKQVDDNVAEIVGEIGFVLILFVILAVFCGRVTSIEISGIIGVILGLTFLFFQDQFKELIRHLPLISIMFKARKYVTDWGENTPGLTVDLYPQSDESLRVDFTFDEDELAVDFESLQSSENLNPLS